MKRVKFKKEFKSLQEAIDRVPNEVKEDMNIFEMTDGNKTFTMRWEGNIEEGVAIALDSKDNQLHEDTMAHMKHLMGYKSEDTLGTLKGEAFINENEKIKELISCKKKL